MDKADIKWVVWEYVIPTVLLPMNLAVLLFIYLPFRYLARYRNKKQHDSSNIG